MQYRCQLCNTLHVSLVALGQHQQQQHGLFPGAQDDAEREDVLRIIQVRYVGVLASWCAFKQL